MSMKDVVAAWAAGVMAVVVALGGLTLASETTTASPPVAARTLDSAAYGGADWAVDLWEATGTIPAHAPAGTRDHYDEPMDPVEIEAMNSVLAGP